MSDTKHSGSRTLDDGASAHSLLDRLLTEEDLRVGAEWASRPAAPRSTGAFGVLLFIVCGEVFALCVAALRRIAGPAKPLHLPHRTNTIVRGLCNVRGELLLYADLAAALGLPRDVEDEDPRSGVLIVLGPLDAPWVIRADRIIGVERVEQSDMQSAPVTVRYARPEVTSGIVRCAGHEATLLVADRLLGVFEAALA